MAINTSQKRIADAPIGAVMTFLLSIFPTYGGPDQFRRGIAVVV